MKIVWGRSIGWNMSFNGIGKHRPAGWTPVKITQKIFDGADCYRWRKTWAIWPVRTISGKRVWLKTVYKHKYWAVWGTGFHMEPQVEYAELFDVLTYNYDSV